MLGLFNKRKNVEQLIEVAAKRKIISQEQIEKLTDLASELNFNKGSLSLVSALGRVGAFTVFVGIILIISSNWDKIGDVSKIGAFITLLAGTHIAALFLKEKKPDLVKTAGTLHFLGALLFIAGVGLIAQIYNLSSDNGTAFLLWFIAVLPIAVILRSGPISLLSAAAFFIWFNIFAINNDYIGLNNSVSGVGVINFSAVIFLLCILLRFKDSFAEDIFDYFERPLILAIGAFIYVYGFCQHIISDTYHYYYSSERGIIYVLPIATTVAAISAALVLLNTKKVNVLLRNMVLVLIVASVSALLVYFIDMGVLASGEVSTFFLSVVFWAIWFVLGFWATVYGSLNSNRNLLNAGVYSIGLGVMTRFFDLVGSMMGTGIMFVVSGIFLLGLGYALEKWRRTLLAKMTPKLKKGRAV